MNEDLPAHVHRGVSPWRLLFPLALAACSLEASADPPPAPTTADTVRTTADWLALLPDGETKRRFILDCAGCHPLDDEVMTANGAPRTREDWARAIGLMLSFAGANTGFPVIGASRQAEPTAAWLAEHLRALPPAPDRARISDRWEVVEYPLPRAGDLPHDLAVDATGRVVVTGMLSNVMYVLDPATGDFADLPIPVGGANPRAVELARDGAWWVVLGGPMRLARRDPGSGEWRHWNVGVYPHEAAIDSSGRVWFNGHFTRDPELIGYVDPNGEGDPVRFEVPGPGMDDGGTTIPYGLRVGTDGTVWLTELAGGRLVGLDPETGDFRVHPLPEPFSGPRRLDVAPDGTVWIPEFAAGRLAAFDPATSRFREYPVPIKDALPYVARIHPLSGDVWVSLAGVGAVARFDPGEESFEVVPLPTRDGIIRHLAIDPRNGDVWGVYGSFPARSQMIFRIRAR